MDHKTIALATGLEEPRNWKQRTKELHNDLDLGRMDDTAHTLVFCAKRLDGSTYGVSGYGVGPTS